MASAINPGPIVMKQDQAKRAQPFADHDRPGRKRRRGQDVQAAALPFLGHRGRRDRREHQQAEGSRGGRRRRTPAISHALGPRRKSTPFFQKAMAPTDAQYPGRAHEQSEDEPSSRARVANDATRARARDCGQATGPGKPSRHPAEQAEIAVPCSSRPYPGRRPAASARPRVRSAGPRPAAPRRRRRDSPRGFELARVGVGGERHVERVGQQSPRRSWADPPGPGQEIPDRPDM